MLQAAVAKFYGCSPLEVDKLSMLQIEAALVLAQQLKEG